MTKIIKHKFVSATADGGDASLVRPSNWNDDHNLFLGYRKVTATSDTISDADNLTIIRYNSASAVTANIPVPSGGTMPLGWSTELVNIGVGVVTLTGTGGATVNGAGTLALNQNDHVQIWSDGGPDYFAITVRYVAAATSATTGDTKLTYKSIADVGWIMADDRTIGDSLSGATNRANADTQALFTMMWTNITDANCPVSGGRGASALADFNAHKTITLPKLQCRALGVSGSVDTGLVAKGFGTAGGVETATSFSNFQHLHNFYNGGVPITVPPAPTLGGYWGPAVNGYVYSDSIGIVGTSAGYTVFQPTTYMALEIKL